MSQKSYLPALIECGRDAIDEWLNHTERVKAACAAGVPEPVWPRVSCRAVAALPPPSAPLPLVHASYEALATALLEYVRLETAASLAAEFREEAGGGVRRRMRVVRAEAHEAGMLDLRLVTDEQSGAAPAAAARSSAARSSTPSPSPAPSEIGEGDVLELRAAGAAALPLPCALAVVVIVERGGGMRVRVDGARSSEGFAGATVVIRRVGTATPSLRMAEALRGF